METGTDTQIRSLHAVYCRETGLDLPLTMNRMYQWEVLIATGVTESDLKLVIRHIRRKVGDRDKAIRAFRFEWFIGKPDTFAEDLAEAKAVARRPKVDPERERVLAATGRGKVDDPLANVKPVGDVIKAMAAFKAFQALKEKL